MSVSDDPNEYLEGVCKWYNKDKGYGFIKMGNGYLDVFFHAKQLRQSGIHRALEENEKIRFVMTNGPKGLFAEQISIVED